MITCGYQGAVLHDVVGIFFSDCYHDAVVSFDQLLGKLLLLAEHFDETLRLRKVVVLRNIENVRKSFHVQVDIQHILQSFQEVRHYIFRKPAHCHDVRFDIRNDVVRKCLADGLSFIIVCHRLGKKLQVVFCVRYAHTHRLVGNLAALADDHQNHSMFIHRKEIDVFQNIFVLARCQCKRCQIRYLRKHARRIFYRLLKIVHPAAQSVCDDILFFFRKFFFLHQSVYI